MRVSWCTWYYVTYETNDTIAHQNLTSLSPSEDPTTSTYEEASKHEIWLKADTWELTTLPMRQKDRCEKDIQY